MLGEQRDGVGGPALASADETEGLAGRRFDGNQKWGDLQRVSDVLAHPVHIRSDFRLFQHESGVDVHDVQPVLRQQVCNMLEENQAGDAFETGIAVGKVPADIPQCSRTKKSVGDGMQEQIRIGVSFEASIIRNLHATDNARPSRDEAVDIVSKSYAGGSSDGFT